MKTRLILPISLFLILITSCSKMDDDTMKALDPDTAGDVSVDRFSAEAAHLFVRTAENGFPAANAAIDFDAIPAFITKGLGPNGEMTQYYNFDVMSTTPAPIYVLFRENETAPVAGQLNIVNVIPGSPYYN